MEYSEASIRQTDKAITRVFFLFPGPPSVCPVSRGTEKEVGQQSVHHEIQPRKPMIDICNLGQFAPVFQFFPQTLAAPVLTVEMGKFGVTSYYVNDHANALLAASLMGTHCPRVRVITTLSRLFFRPWKSCRTDSSVCIVYIRSPMPMPMPIPIPIPTAVSTRVIVG